MAIIHCGNIECKYCNDKYKCTNKKVELNFMGINTTNQGFQKLLKCTSFEESDQYKKAKILIDKFCDFEFNSEFEVVDYMYQKRKNLEDKER